MEITELEDGTSVDKMMDDLLFFIDHNVMFNGKLVDSIINNFRDNGQMSEKQLEVLINIYKKNKVADYVSDRR